MRRNTSRCSATEAFTTKAGPRLHGTRRDGFSSARTPGIRRRLDWELCSTTSKDWSQANNLAQQMPEKLHQLQRLWQQSRRYATTYFPSTTGALKGLAPDAEAGRNQVCSLRATPKFCFWQRGHLSENSVLNIETKNLIPVTGWEFLYPRPVLRASSSPKAATQRP